MGERYSYVMPEHVAVFADVAPKLQILLAPGRERLRREGFTLDARLAAFLADLDAMSPPPSSRPSTQAWISSQVAADMLGISVRGMQALGHRNRWGTRLRGRRREWLLDDVAFEAEGRNVSEHAGTRVEDESAEWVA